MLINIAEIDRSCKVLGPGRRYIIWVQGCLKRCEGCYNRDYQPLIENQLLDTQDIIDDILKYKDKNSLEGITFLGGEPLLQALQLREIAKSAQENNLTVLCYTGYEYKDIKDNIEVANLLKYVDVLIDGEFKQEEKIDRGFRGSSNQNIIFFTQKYTEKDFSVFNSYEIEIKNSNLKIKGFYR